MRRLLLPLLFSYCCAYALSISTPSYQIDPVEESAFWERIFNEGTRVVISCGGGELLPIETDELKVKCIDRRSIVLSSVEKGTQRFFVIEKEGKKQGTILIEYLFKETPSPIALKECFKRGKRLSGDGNLVFVGGDENLVLGLTATYAMFKEGVEKRVSSREEIGLEWVEAFRASLE